MQYLYTYTYCYAYPKHLNCSGKVYQEPIFWFLEFFFRSGFKNSAIGGGGGGISLTAVMKIKFLWQNFDTIMRLMRFFTRFSPYWRGPFCLHYKWKALFNFHYRELWLKRNESFKSWLLQHPSLRIVSQPLEAFGTNVKFDQKFRCLAGFNSPCSV